MNKIISVTSTIEMTMSPYKLYFILTCSLILPTLKCTGIKNDASIMGVTPVHLREVEDLIVALDAVLNFVNRYFYRMNLDCALGIVLAQAQLIQAVEYSTDENLMQTLMMLIQKSQVYRQIIEILPKDSKNLLLIKFLLNPPMWIRNVKFINGELTNLGIYESWTPEDIMKNKSAEYMGVTSDECVLQVLQEIPENLETHLCSLDSKCRMLMFGNRNDTSYVLTHRLLFLQILRTTKCLINEKLLSDQIRTYCSLILKESKTNAYLGFPQHDIFLEQVVLCGMEGFTEFFINQWRISVMQWQTAESCYGEHSIYTGREIIGVRSANNIGFGCTDHATGLGAAALSVNLHHILQKSVGYL